MLRWRSNASAPCRSKGTRVQGQHPSTPAPQHISLEGSEEVRGPKVSDAAVSSATLKPFGLPRPSLPNINNGVAGGVTLKSRDDNRLPGTLTEMPSSVSPSRLQGRWPAHIGRSFIWLNTARPKRL